MIVVFTPVHGRSDIAARTFASIEAVVPPPFAHVVFDDYSPPQDAEWYASCGRTIEEDTYRVLVHAADFAECDTGPPNMGVGLLWSWCQAKDSDAEALLCVESDVILRPGVVEAFREAQVLHKGRAGAIAPIFTIPGQNTINSFGGVDERGFMGLSRGDEVGSWRPCQTKIDVLPWAHLACLWIPAATLARDDIAPDPAFRLYFQDQDVSHQITAAGLDIIVVDGAVAEHGGGASTSVLWPNPADIQNAYRSGRAQLREKWGS